MAEKKEKLIRNLARALNSDSAKKLYSKRVVGAGAAGVASTLLTACGAQNAFRSASESPSLPPTETTASAAAAAGQSPSPSPSASGDAKLTPTDISKRPASNVPMRKFAPGEMPPQFIIFSFDGAAYHKKWVAFRQKAKEVNARITGFLSGVYLVTDDKSGEFVPPPPSPQGQSGIGFGGSQDDVKLAVQDLNEAYAEGHEIGTHYNAHMCGGIGNDWTTEQWTQELTEFFRWWDNWNQLDGIAEPKLQIPKEEVKGGRTPCLEGQEALMFPAFQNFGMTYDTSLPGPVPGVAWPIKTTGLWEFYMPFVQSDAFGQRVTCMDYNFWFTFNGAQNKPATQPELTSKVLSTYQQVYTATKNGNRAPVLIANHFNDWNGDSFNPAALQFMDVCKDEGTICATYQDVIKWMEMQDPAYLAELQARPAVG